MKDLLLNIVKALVNNPNDISVNEVEQGNVTILELKTAQEDVGRIIGKEGRTIKTIRTLVNAVAAKNNKKVVVEVLG